MKYPFYKNIQHYLNRQDGLKNTELNNYSTCKFYYIHAKVVMNYRTNMQDA